MLAALAGGLSACSLLVDFEPEGQPCDDRNQCLAGYVCQLGSCTALDGGTPDGGLTRDGGTDAGTDAGRGANDFCDDPAGCSASPEAY
jgi:hypothetical protein